MATEHIQHVENEHTEQRIAMSYEDFLRTTDDGTQAEWVDGKVTVFMPPTNRHQDVLRFLAKLIDTFVELFGLGITRFAPFEVRLGLGRSSREPDLFFVAKTNLNRITSKRLEGPPDLVVEIISPESVYRDRVDKFDEYEAAGVREYWVIDPRPEHARVWFFVLDEAGRLQPVAVQPDGRYTSTVLPGFSFPVDWLWQEELPTLMQCLRTILGPQALLNFVQNATASSAD